MSVKSRPNPTGGHEIYSDSIGQDVVLVRVRPVGTLEMGDISECFVTLWVPELIEALTMARSIADGDEKAETGHDIGLSHAAEFFPQHKGPR